jgi:hypothetical protein
MSQPPANQYPGQPQARPPRPRRKRLRRRNVVLLAIGAVLLIVVIANASGGSGNPGNQKLSAASAAAARAASLADSEKSAERACGERPPASRDIYVRIIKPGTSPKARKLAGRWRWDHATGKCLTAIHFMTATAPRSDGHCTQVGYVTDNPGYDPNATPAPPLRRTAAQAGPACAAAAAPPSSPPPSSPPPSSPPPSSPPRTLPPTAPPTEATPTAMAPPPAPTTPAGCYPLSDEGTCYEPGEYCRDDDHGASGVAGDGEEIICEYNDGWRWEPA